MSVKSVLDRSRRIRTPVLPISAIFVYALLGIELHFFVWLAVIWPHEFHPLSYHFGVLELWWGGYVFAWSIPETLMVVHLLAVILLWCTWRGWLAAHARRARSTPGAALAFLVPALVLAMFSWVLAQSMDVPFPLKEYSIRRIEGSMTR